MSEEGFKHVAPRLRKQSASNARGFRVSSQPTDSWAGGLQWFPALDEIKEKKSG